MQVYTIYTLYIVDGRGGSVVHMEYTSHGNQYKSMHTIVVAITTHYISVFGNWLNCVLVMNGRTTFQHDWYQIYSNEQYENSTFKNKQESNWNKTICSNDI